MNLTTQDFKDKIFDYSISDDWKYKGELPAVIEYGAAWCAPCHTLEPVLNEIAEELRGKLVVHTIDVDAEQELAMKFGIQSIPTILFVPLEGPPTTAFGATSKENLIKAIGDILNVKQEVF